MKTCVTCLHFQVSADCSEYADHFPFSMVCEQGRWKTYFDACDTTTDGFRERMLSAEKCSSYQDYKTGRSQ